MLNYQLLKRCLPRLLQCKSCQSQTQKRSEPQVDPVVHSRKKIVPWKRMPNNSVSRLMKLFTAAQEGGVSGSSDISVAYYTDDM